MWYPGIVKCFKIHTLYSDFFPTALKKIKLFWTPTALMQNISHDLCSFLFVYPKSFLLWHSLQKMSKGWFCIFRPICDQPPVQCRNKNVKGHFRFFLFYPHNTKPDNTDEEKQVRLYLEIYPILAKSCCIQQNNMVDIIKFKIWYHLQPLYTKAVLASDKRVRSRQAKSGGRDNKMLVHASSSNTNTNYYLQTGKIWRLV